MTLIAFATHGETADIITDTFAYDNNVRHSGHASKVTGLPHIDAALMTQGNAAFGTVAAVMLGTLVYEAPTFDDLVNVAPDELRGVWGDTPRAGGGEATVFLVGWSPSRERFAAFGFAADTDFVPWEIDGTFIMPSPLVYRPSELELSRLEGSVNMTDPSALSEALRELPLPPTPTSRDEWVDLALDAKLQRSSSMGAGMVYGKVMISGSLHLTRLERGKQTVEVVHTFDTSGPEFLDMVSGTLHPVAQLAACGCGSGARFIDCCMAAHRDESCPCGSSKALKDCCMVSVGADVAAEVA